MTTTDADVIVIGAGPAGLSAARALAGTHTVIVLERESVAGGIPRHCDHTGYGIRDLRRMMTGPRYAQRLVEMSRDAGATVVTGTTVTGLDAEHLTVTATSPQGIRTFSGAAIIVATGARERPRPARLIAGDRGQGVMTTGQLQNLVHLKHRHDIGTRAVIVGAELVSYSAVLTLREAGCRTVAMVTPYTRSGLYSPAVGPFAATWRTPLITGANVSDIYGKERVTGVRITDTRGRFRDLDCDTVVVTGEWVPDSELARTAGLSVAAGTRGSPQVDQALRTSAPGIFAIGNLVHPADTADVAALDGLHLADEVSRWLGDTALGTASWPSLAIEVQAGDGLRWITPSRLVPGDAAPPRNRLLGWTDEAFRAPRVVVEQGGRQVTARRLPWAAVPGRIVRIPASYLDAVTPQAGPVRVSLR